MSVPTCLLRRKLSCHRQLKDLARLEVSGVCGDQAKIRIVNCLLFYLCQSTAADSYGTDGENASSNLIKLNVYYSSMNEKTIEDKIDYRIEVGTKK